MAIFNQVSPNKSRGGFEDANRQILSGTVAPGTSQETINATVGSTYEFTGVNGGSSWIKKQSGAGLTAWTRLADLNDLSSQASANSWLEPALVLDSTSASTAAAVTTMDVADTLDGVMVTAADRVLLTGIASPGVYVVGGVSGAWTLTATAVVEKAGDNIEIISGTHGRQLWNFDGTTWGWFGQNSSSEEVALRAFIGKSVAGTVATAYTSTLFVTNGSSLAVSIGDLDAALGVVQTAANSAMSTANSAQTTASNLVTGTGLNANGTMTPIAGTYVTSASASLRGAIVELDTKVAAAVNSLQLQLDTAVKRSSVAGVNASIVDTVLCRDARVVSWMMSVFDTVSGSVFSAVVKASHNGTATTSATVRKWNAGDEFEMGTEIAGLSLDVALNGAGATQSLDLTFSSTNPCDIVATRLTA